MTGRASFGDFAQAARRHLAALPVSAERPNPDIVAREIRDYNYGLHRILRTMVRYAADLATTSQLVSGQDAGSPDWWSQAAAEARRALQDAHLYSPLHGTAGKRAPEARRTGPLARQLAAAADAMVIGRDLLQTHFTTSADGIRAPRTEWSALIDSAAVSRALLTELGGWAREIANRTTSLTVAPTMRSAQTRTEQQRFTAMHRGLAAAAEAIETAQDHVPIQQRDLAQLHAVRVNVPNPRRLPSGAETIKELCQGIHGTAERVRRAFAATAPEAAWSPELTASSLRQTAAATALISQHCQLIQQALADRAADLRVSRLGPGLRASARTAGQARQAWLKAGRAWKFIETDAAKGTTSATAEVADLVVWTGCLAYGDPNWKPGMRKASPSRSAASLAPTPADLNLVADAVRDAASTMVAIAAADYSRIRTAAQTGRLLTAVEALFIRPDGFRFTRASRYHTTNLLEAYRDAGATSVQAMDGMSQIVGQIQDHDRLISERERERAKSGDGVRIVGRRSKRKPDLLSAAGRAELNAGREMPGPVERKLLDLGVTDSAFLARGTAVDQAGLQLIGEAAQGTASLRWNTAVTGRKTIVNVETVVGDVLAHGRREPDAPSIARAAGGGGSRSQAEAGSWQAEP
jgi:hypothetical protein